MPKKRSRRRSNSNFGVIKFQTQLALGALGTDVVISVNLTALTQSFYCISADCLWALRAIDAGDLPMTVGFSNGDLSVTEIAESLDANPVSQSDIIAIERTRRPVRYAGQFAHEAASVPLVIQIDEGRMVRTKLKFAVREGNELAAWIRNQSAAALTAGAVLEISGKIYGRWL